MDEFFENFHGGHVVIFPDTYQHTIHTQSHPRIAPHTMLHPSKGGLEFVPLPRSSLYLISADFLTFSLSPLFLADIILHSGIFQILTQFPLIFSHFLSLTLLSHRNSCNDTISTPTNLLQPTFSFPLKFKGQCPVSSDLRYCILLLQNTGLMLT